MKCQSRDQQRLGLVLHTSETVHFPRLLTKESLKQKDTKLSKSVYFSARGDVSNGLGMLFLNAQLFPMILQILRWAELPRSLRMGMRRAVGIHSGDSPWKTYDSLSLGCQGFSRQRLAQKSSRQVHPSGLGSDLHMNVWILWNFTIASDSWWGIHEGYLMLNLRFNDSYISTSK